MFPPSTEPDLALAETYCDYVYTIIKIALSLCGTVVSNVKPHLRHERTKRHVSVRCVSQGRLSYGGTRRDAF